MECCFPMCTSIKRKINTNLQRIQIEFQLRNALRRIGIPVDRKIHQHVAFRSHLRGIKERDKNIESNNRRWVCSQKVSRIF